MLSETKSEKDKYAVISLYWNKKTLLKHKIKSTSTENRLVVADGGFEGFGKGLKRVQR